MVRPAASASSSGLSRAFVSRRISAADLPASDDDATTWNGAGFPAAWRAELGMDLSQLSTLGKVAGVPGIALGAVVLLLGAVLAATNVLPERGGAAR